MATHIGEQWGNYQLVRLLGQGGFAEVYLGEHVRLGMRAAIKILHSRLAGEDIANFQREARTIAELAHPHIIRVLDFDVQQGVPFLVLEYAPNGSLRQKHQLREQIPLAQVVDYVQQIASALQYAHDRKLVHRDVKPENMLLNAQGQVVLTDFGIATIAHSTSSMRPQETSGTLAYMAPEQIQGKPRPASDQYALAVTVYQWLTGNLPFQGSASEIIAQHLAVMPPPPSEKAPNISPEVDQATLTALQKNPQERFGSVQAFANAFTVASNETSRTASSTPPLLPTQRTVPSPAVHTATRFTPAGSTARETPRPVRKTRIWLIAALLLVMIGVIAAIVIPMSLTNSSPDITNCVVGNNYDPSTGKAQEESTHFSSGITVYLVCQIAPGSILGAVTDNVVWTDNHGGGGERGLGSGFSDPTYNIYYDDVSVGAGSYTWYVFYNGRQEASLSFQVT
ncbi:MAG TPA: serine/threonine-protein kinase [Ktedonobacteraceae bacterium]|nr:serine/threonine-protein kinase [Ktedonobacteraceae bacterium]